MCNIKIAMLFVASKNKIHQISFLDSCKRQKLNKHSRYNPLPAKLTTGYNATSHS
jgi:hypothetical protein